MICTCLCLSKIWAIIEHDWENIGIAVFKHSANLKGSQPKIRGKYQKIGGVWTLGILTFRMYGPGR